MKIFRLRVVLLILLLALVASQALVPAGTPAQQAKRAAAPATRAEILWDRYGVPHIFAQDARSLHFAMGWAQMKAHGNLLLRLYGESRGRAAEYWGADQLESDRWVRAMGVPARAKQWYAQQKPEFREHLDAFAAGINAYAREHSGEIAADVKPVLPVEPADVLAHFQRIIHFEFIASRGSVVAAARRQPAAASGASNAWAVAPKRATGGHALLLANPHLAWSGWGTWFEAQLVAPGLDAYGATLVGFPGVSIAFNDALGWTHTVNTIDAADVYELTLTEGGYRWDGGVKAFETEDDAIKVKQSDGTLRSEKYTVRRSVHGPVVFERAGKALALRVAGLDQPAVFEQYWQMMRAKNLAEFEAALRMLQMPMFTVLYADRAGNILHLFGGRVPARPAGDWDWSGVVPGDTSATLWTTTHAYDDLPRVLNPESGWLQNANDPPWTTTFPLALDAAKFPRYMSPRAMSFRAQHSARLLETDERISFEEVVQYKHSTHLEAADRTLDDLIVVARQGGKVARRAAAVLEKWDRATDATSRGAVLFRAFWQQLLRRSGSGRVFAQPWDEKSPRSTPRGLADPATAVAALEAAAQQVETAFGALDVAWGDVNRLRGGGADLPANGGPSALGAFRVVGYQPGRDGKFTAVSGDSYVAVVEFSNPVRARTLVSYGNASQPGSSHAADQFPLFAKKELRPVWRARKEIEAHLESREPLERK
jgi:acyl-homoserine-lactone acylase